MKIYAVFTSITSVFWLVVLAFEGHLTVINTAFMTGLILLVLAAVITIFKSSLFRIFWKGFSMIKDWFTPENRGMQRTNELIEEDAAFQEFKERLQQVLVSILLSIGIPSIIMSIIVIFFY